MKVEYKCDCGFEEVLENTRWYPQVILCEDCGEPIGAEEREYR